MEAELEEIVFSIAGAQGRDMFDSPADRPVSGIRRTLRFGSILSHYSARPKDSVREQIASIQAVVEHADMISLGGAGRAIESSLGTKVMQLFRTVVNRPASKPFQSSSFQFFVKIVVKNA